MTSSMTKTAFLAELQRKLKDMPESEIASAVAYYDEYLSEAGPENEAAAIVELGSPAEVAATVIGDYVYAGTTSDDKSIKKGFTAIWLIVLAILASPVALVVAIFLISFIFSLLTSALSVAFALFLAAGATVFAGVIYLAVGFWTLFFSFSSGIITIGIGLVLLAIGSAMTLALLWLTKHLVNGVALLGAKLLRRWKNRDGVTA